MAKAYARAHVSQTEDGKEEKDGSNNGSSIARQHSDTATKESAIFFSGREGESARAAAIYEKIREEELVPQGAADRDIHALLSVWVRLGSPSN